MHELSLAQNIIDTVREHVGNDRLAKVTEVVMEVGTASGVVGESLQFAYEAIVQDTPLASSTMTMVSVPFTVRCHACGTETESPAGFMVCPHCDSMDVSVVKGADMILKQIVVNDD